MISVLSNQVVMVNPAVPKSPEDENNKDKFDPANDDDSSSSSSKDCGLNITNSAMEDCGTTKYVMEDCGATNYTVEDSGTTRYAIVDHDTNSPTETASNRVATQVGNVVNPNFGSERNLKTEVEPTSDSSMATNNRINSWKSLSANGITTYAHLARRIAREDNIKHSHVPEVDCDKSREFSNDKEFGFEDKGKINHTYMYNSDRNSSIKYNGPSCSESSKEQVRFFDAAIVYDKEDYEGALDLRNALISIVKSNMYEDPRIELFDSKEFAQSNIMIVEDIVNRCSLVLVYLTRNFTSPELHLFIEEAIGISRFGYNDPGIQSGRVSNQRQWVLKPVHTQSRKYRDYKTPVGLLTVNGIDWFDRSSGHTRSHIIALLQTAITQRKQRDLEVNTSNIYKQMFGSLPEVPHLGPPFTNRRLKPTATFPDAPRHWRAHQLISHPSEDAMSVFPVSSVHQQIPPAEHPHRPMWNKYSDANVGVQGIGHQHMPPSTSLDSSIAYGISRDYTVKPEFVSRTASAAFPGSPTMSPYGVPQIRHLHTNQQVRSQPTSGQQFPHVPVQHMHQHHFAPTKPGIVYQSAGLQTHRAHAEQQLPGYMNQQPPVMPTTHVRGVPMHTDVRNPQIPIYPPTMNVQQTGPYDTYQNELSQDALPSATSSYLRDVMHDTTSSSRLGVVSKVSGKLIVNPSLSTDDVEVDNVSEPIITSNKVTKKHMTGNGKQVSHDDSSESDDSDCDLDLPAETRVVNIVGCKVVQIGKGNRVLKADRIPVDKMDVPHNMEKDIDVDKVHSNRSWKTSRSPQIIIPAEQQRGKSRDSEMNNFSISEDDMSLESSTSQNVNYQMTHKPTLEKNMKFSGNGNNGQEYFEVQSTQPLQQKNELSVHSEKHEEATRLRKRQNRPMLNVSVSDCGGSSADDNVSVSPDDNISEEQLFGSGSIRPYRSSENNPGTTSDAPFTFSQATRHTGHFGLLFRCHLSNQTDSTNTSDESEID